ncbi:serine/threonine-protein kinase [Streptomyces ficellus]|uniref:non-specific serine/threonine protein kinase n=1 Tax=Streptomyces ficellus TaxID=1977088 RepID=A0ABT7Z6G3_9ACTN|nr:serine/threonine-protein kinase [Streptomyces ficellus]MDN3294867.1 serine/threonine-protein kinase [Streptomyces ficellus]
MGAGLVLAGRYRLSEVIGRGGMGKVWRAHDEVLHRTVAVKELTAGRYVSEADRVVLHARTQKEARAAARITHPGVVTVHDVLEHDDRPWIVMQHVDGPSLADAAKEAENRRIDAREAARIGLHVLGALRAAHAAGVLHRDVKPGNVLLARDGRVLLTDFGIAAIEGDSTITRTGELVGSIDYLAPERVRGGDPGPASDLWSLGATLYAAVEGNSPFRRTSPISTMQAVVTEEPSPAVHAGPLGPVITALLRKDPADRPEAAETGRMLLEAMEGRTPAAAQAYVPTRPVSREELAAATAELPAPASAPIPAPVHAPEPGRDQSERHRPYAREAADVNPAPRRQRWRTAALVVVLAAAVGSAAGFGVMRYGGQGDGGSEGRGGSAPAEGSVPEGWERVEDPTGFSLLIPKGWKRLSEGGRIDYTPDNGRHLIRISADASPDYDDPCRHMLDIEKGLKKRLPRYERKQLRTNTFRDQLESCLWEFTWVEKNANAGERHAIDQVYYADDGTEYALFMSAPAADWPVTREQFDIVLRGWRPAEE